METECDFMEIDNNIAARLQIPSLQEQKDSDIPESLPVPMLANFGHFEDSDEKESSFMTSNVEGNENVEAVDSDEPAGSLAKSDTTHRDTLSSQDLNFEGSETRKAESSLGKQEGDGENSNQNLPLEGGGYAVDTEDAFLSFDGGHLDIQTVGSSPLFCDENYVVGAAERRSSDNSDSTNESFLSGLEPRTENKIGEPGSKHEQTTFHGNSENTSITARTDPLHNIVNELFVGASRPPNETGNDHGGTDGTASPDREFVFVNPDGTAQGSPKPRRHPLENSDEFFY